MPTNLPKISLRTIAEAAGVSVMTVSHALRNRRNVSSATRARIQEIASSMGYRPDPETVRYMAYIRQQRATNHYSATLAFLDYRVGRDDPDGCERQRLILAGARQRAEETGYKVEHFFAGDPKLSHRRLIQILRTRGIDSIIISPGPASHSGSGLDFAGFFAAAVGVSPGEPQVPVVAHDEFAGMIKALQALRSLGYQRPGYIATAAPGESAGGRSLGAYLASTCHLPEQDRLTPLFVRSEWHQAEVEHWLASENPDVILSPDARVVPVLEEAGLEIPNDLGFVLLDSAAGDPSWAGIDQEHEKIGRIAVDKVLAQRNNPTEPAAAPLASLTAGTWHPGSTLRPQVYIDHHLSALPVGAGLGCE